MRSPFDYSAPGSLLKVLRNGNGSGSGGGQQSYQQTKSSNEPPAYLQPYLQRGVQELDWLARYNNFRGPEYYPGETVAPFSDQTQAALDWQTARAVGGSPLTSAAQDQLTKTMRGDYLAPGSNPYFADALTASLKPQTEQFMSTVLPGINSTFAGAGRYGSGLHQASVDRAVTGLNRAQADASVKAGADMYAMERANQIAGMKFAPALANQDYFDINQLGVVGSALDDQRQRQIDADVTKYNYNQNKDWNYINRYLASLNAGYPGGESSGSGYGFMPRAGGGDTFGSVFGAGMGAAGLGLQAFSLFSDERLKEDIAPVGKLNDGQTVYSYRYKGDPTPHIGLMAQEVAETHPEAVHIDPESGFLKVNYAAATADARAGLF